jgi:hypothetical protein
MICDNHVLEIRGDKNPPKVIQSFKHRTQQTSMVTIGEEILLVGFPNFLQTVFYRFSDGQYQKIYKAPLRARSPLNHNMGVISLKKFGSSSDYFLAQISDIKLLKTELKHDAKWRIKGLREHLKSEVLLSTKECLLDFCETD